MVEPVEHLVYAIHDYDIPGKGFLPLQAGDVVHVVDADVSGWWLGVNLRRQTGVFPSTYTLPFVFPLPPEALLRESKLQLLARRFRVDLTSGSPAPLHTLAADEHPNVCAAASLEALRAALSAGLLDREKSRKAVVDHLERLLACQQRREDADRQRQLALTREERRRAAEEGELSALEAQLREMIDAVEGAKRAHSRRGMVVPLPWYRAFAEVAAAAARGGDGEAAAQAREGVWRSAVMDLRQVAAERAVALEALRQRWAAEEQRYGEAAASLQKRVEWRDEKVAALLEYWAGQAAAVKSAYLEAKAERDAESAANQQEVTRLRSCLEEGKSTFARVKAEYREVKQKAQAISEVLKRQDELDRLSRMIAAVDDEIARKISTRSGVSVS